MKSFIRYPTILLLKYKVDDFGFSITVNKLKTILKLDFPYTLKHLKGY